MQPSPYVPNSPSISVEKQDPNAFIQASSSSPAQANEDQSKSKPNSPIRPGDIASVAHQTSISCRHSQVLSPHNQEPDITLVVHAIHANSSCPFDPTWSTSWGLGFVHGYSWHSWHSMNKWKGAVDRRGPTTSLTDVFCWVLLVECWFQYVRYKLIQSCWGGNCKKACHHTWPWKIPKQGTIFYVWKARGPKIDEINHWLSMSLITVETKESEKLYSRDMPPPQSQKNPCAKNLEQSAGFGGKMWKGHIVKSSSPGIHLCFRAIPFALKLSKVLFSTKRRNRYKEETCFSNTSIYSQHSGLSASVTSTSQTNISVTCPFYLKEAGIWRFSTLHLVSMPPRELHPLTCAVPVPFTGLTEAPGDSKVKLPCVVTCRTEKQNCSYTAKKSVEAWRDLLNGKFMSVSLDISTRTVVKSFAISRFFVKE